MPALVAVALMAPELIFGFCYGEDATGCTFQSRIKLIFGNVEFTQDFFSEDCADTHQNI